MRITKHATVLQARNLDGHQDFVIFGREPDEPGDIGSVLWLERGKFHELGEPLEITVSVQPGNVLQPPEPELDPMLATSLTPGRCEACGGWTERDDAPLCNMCVEMGVDLENLRLIRQGGTKAAPILTSEHSISVDSLPYEGGWYTLPDGSKARPDDVEQALQNWYDSNVTPVERDQPIATPVS